MNRTRELLARLLVHGAVAALVFWAGWRLLSTARGGWAATPQLLLGMGCLVLAAVVAAPAVARILAEPTGGLHYPKVWTGKPQPLYSVAEAQRKRGRTEEAMARYERIATQYPQELKPYVDMIDIAIVDLKDRRRAAEILARGMANLTDEKHRAALARMHTAILSRLQPRQPKPLRKIPFQPRRP